MFFFVKHYFDRKIVRTWKNPVKSADENGERSAAFASTERTVYQAGSNF